MFVTGISGILIESITGQFSAMGIGHCPCFVQVVRDCLEMHRDCFLQLRPSLLGSKTGSRTPTESFGILYFQLRRLLDHITLMVGVPAEAKYLIALACYKAAFVACSLVFISMVVSSWYLGDFRYAFGKVGENTTLMMCAT